jgi:TRAP-type mannitol/chloroaromatic compound transport system permease small subunit
MLLPLVLAMIWLTIPFVAESYQGHEISTNAGGLVVWPSKLFILLGFVLLLFQVISEVIKRVGFLTGALKEAEPEATHGLTPEDLGVHGGPQK